MEPIPWSDNNSSLIWSLISELQKPENYKVLYGKKPGENTTGDTKISVYKRIASVLFPAYFPKATKENPNPPPITKELQAIQTNLATRVKSRADDLVKTYKKHAGRLRLTGSGLGDPNGDSQPDGADVYLEHYVPASGPCGDTPQVIKNIWDDINRSFVFFSEIHKFLSTRPNVIPISITTGVGPRGRQTVHMQPPARNPYTPVNDGNSQSPPPDDGGITNPGPAAADPAGPAAARVLPISPTPPVATVTSISPVVPTLSVVSTPLVMPTLPAMSAPPTALVPSTPPPRLFGHDQVNTPPASRCTPKPSPFASASQDRIDQAKANIKLMPKKRSLEDTIIEISKTNMDANIAARNADAVRSDLARLERQREWSLKEYKEGLISRREYRKKMERYDDEEETLKRMLLGTPKKCARYRDVSPDWDETLPSDTESV